MKFFIFIELIFENIVGYAFEIIRYLFMLYPLYFYYLLLNIVHFFNSSDIIHELDINSLQSLSK
jgi:hypothetical protein